KEFLVYTGDDVMTLPSISVGAYGVVSVSSHIVGGDMKKMISSFTDGDINQARELHLKLLNIFQKLFIVANPIPVKAALNMIGYNVGGVRLPLTEAKENILEEIKKKINKIKI